MTISTLLLLSCLLLLSPSLSSAHSWLDCTNMLDSGCAGFPLGYPSRGDVDINTKYTYLVQDRRPDAPVCQPGRQDIPGNNPFPPASVTPGQNLHLTWQPDGHLDDAHPSTIELHWTGVPGKQLYRRSDLGPVTLLGTMTFATSANCDQAWEPNTWCHGHVTVPVATQPGTYQVVWWWKYDRNPAGEEYSTCFEIVVGGNGSGILPREIEVKAQSQPEARIQMAANEGPRTFEMAYMTTSSEKTERDDSPVSSHDVGQQSLTELIAQPDEPLSEIPNSSIENDTKPMQQMTNGYVDDDLGTLAGDAINDDEDTDTSPLPVASPSQLVNTMLVEQMHANAGSNGNNPAAPTSKTNATINTSLTPSSTNVSSTATTSVTPASTTVGGSRDRNLVGQYPFDSSALTARSMPWVSVCTTLILSGLLALLVL